MAPTDHDSLACALGIAAPWRVVDAHLPPDGQVFTVRVERMPVRPTGLFLRRAAPPPQRHLRWEHLGLGELRCQIVLGLREGETPPVAPWCGEPDQGHSRALQRRMTDLLQAGLTLDQLCLLLRLPVGEVWRHKYKLEQSLGRAVARAPSVQAQAQVQVQAHGPVSPVAAAASGAAGASGTLVLARGSLQAPPSIADELGLPPEPSGVWMDLLLGRLTLDVRPLGLRLLLAKLQRDAALHQDADLHRQAASELHRHFLRQRAQLGPELAQLRLAATPARAGDAPAEDVRGLPAAGDPLWSALLDGDVRLDVRTLGLKLLLARLQQQLRGSHDEPLRSDKRDELRRFFLRHRGALDHELRQLAELAAHRGLHAGG